MTLVATTQAIQYQPSSPTLSVASYSSRASSVWSDRSTTSSNATSVAWGETDAPSTAKTPTLSELRRTTVLNHQRLITQAQRSLPLPLHQVPQQHHHHDHHVLRQPHPPAVLDVPQQPLPIELRQNARRTNRLVEAKASNCPASEYGSLLGYLRLQHHDLQVGFCH